jgi:trypsin
MRRIAGALLPLIVALAAAGSTQAAVPRYLGPVVDSPSAAPFTVWVGAGDATRVVFCTGSVLDATHVLTAAHCTRNGQDAWPPSAYDLLFGASQLVTPVAGIQERGVSAVRVHPAYDPATGQADVAVLTLSRPLVLSGTVAPITPVAVGAGSSPGSIVRGFGTGSTSSDGSFDNYEHSLDLTVVSADTCGVGLATLSCARSDAGGACPGDSGGPVLQTTTGALTGVLSIGIGGSCVAGSTTGYTDLSVPGIAAWLAAATRRPPCPSRRRPRRSPRPR